MKAQTVYGCFLRNRRKVPHTFNFSPACLEPRPIGQPPRPESAEQQRIAKLERELLEKQLHEQTLKTRLEIAQALAATEGRKGDSRAAFG